MYLNGVQQSRCYQTAIEKWRYGRSTDAQTMGILYWQMNDIWQGPSWASMEFGGRWKPLHYTVRRTFAPTAMSAYQKDGDNSVSFHVVSDELKSRLCSVTYSYVSLTQPGVESLIKRDFALV